MEASIICDRCGSGAHADFIRTLPAVRDAKSAWIVKVVCPQCGSYNRAKFHECATAVVVQATFSGPRLALRRSEIDLTGCPPSALLHSSYDRLD